MENHVENEDPVVVAPCRSPLSVIKSTIQKITLEPVMFLQMVSMLMGAVTTQSLIQLQTCHVKLGYDLTQCQNLSMNDTVQDNVQVETSRVLLYKSLLEGLPGIFLALYLGPWADRHGRKLPLLYNLFMMCASSALMLLFSFKPLLKPEILLIAAAVQGLSGGLVVLLMSVFSYLSEVTTQETRTFRVAVMDACWYVGAPLGMLISGKLLGYGYYVVYCCSTASITLAFVYTLIRLKPLPTEERSNEPWSCWQPPVESFLVLVKKRKAHGHLHINMLIFLMCLYIFGFAGILNLELLYTEKKFDWTAENFTVYATSVMIFGVFGTVLMLIFFSWKYKFSDYFIGIMAAFMDLLGYFIKGIANYGGIMFLGAVIGGFGGLTAVLIRSNISKMVPPEELGKVFSMLASLEAAVPMGGSAFFTFIYDRTVSVFPGAMYCVDSALHIIIAAGFLWIYLDLKKQKQYLAQSTSINDNENLLTNSDVTS